jgi:hypothetical protein
VTEDVIAWFDPGLTTGGAVYDITADRFTSGQYSAVLDVTSGQYSYEELGQCLADLQYMYEGRLAVGYELYIQTPRPRPGSNAKPSNDAIAVIDQACQQYGIPQIKGQPSSARMAGSTTVFLRRLGWYQPGQQHANDAACHLFRHLIRMKPVPENVRKGLPLGY